MRADSARMGARVPHLCELRPNGSDRGPVKRKRQELSKSEVLLDSQAGRRTESIGGSATTSPRESQRGLGLRDLMIKVAALVRLGSGPGNFV